jgi:hypothetical protein
LKTILALTGILIFTNVIGQNLNEHKWKHRVLIIQASDELSDKYRDQLKEFNNVDKELKERKLIIYTIVKDKYKVTNYHNDITDNSWEVANEFFGDLLDKNYGFRVILIGLDGGIKLDKTTVLRRKELFNIIDSMPMRMNELRNNRK